MFEIQDQHAKRDSYSIGDGDGNFLHSDGTILRGAAEYWPSRRLAEDVLNKFQPEHVWEHGDVMTENIGGGNYPKVYIHEAGSEPRIYHLCGMKACGTLHDYLKENPVFLFNIKDKLAD